MSHQCFTPLSLIIGAILALVSTTLNAFDEQLMLSQAPDRSVTFSLHGFRYPCTFAVTAPIVTVSSGQVLLTSQVFQLGCPTIPGASPSPYTQLASVGILPDGAYIVIWKASTLFSVEAPFQIQGGLLVRAEPAPVPSVGRWSLALLILVLGLSSCLVHSPLTRRSSRRGSTLL